MKINVLNKKCHKALYFTFANRSAIFKIAIFIDVAWLNSFLWCYGKWWQLRKWFWLPSSKSHDNLSLGMSGDGMERGEGSIFLMIYLLFYQLLSKNSSYFQMPRTTNQPQMNGTLNYIFMDHIMEWSGLKWKFIKF